ncbi:hypothetical protein MPC4_150117 [Methylocella tundrae]|uniref:Uncharacterized protein n=1 Tax=Methylocella tundrae TaxID=227605 RepID=A0A8B6M3K3_METTU|nr:hypothetical protein MPC1_710007 [Methylocella tundrae]VTZ49335.1 hypothetical protein MPC4_150117 [Methylocella tundrae]
MRSAPIAALRRTVPVQHLGGLIVARLEEVGADRLRECGIVDDE